MSREEPPTDLAEVRRIVDGQVELARAYAERAQTLLRIALTIFGLYVSAIVIAIQFFPGDSSGFTIPWPGFGIETIEHRLVQGLEFLSEPMGSLVAAIPIIAVLILIHRVLSHLDELPDEVLSTLEPTRLQTGIIPSEKIDNYVEEYRRIIRQNEQELSSIEDRWETISTAMFEIIGSISVIFFLAGSLIFGSAEWIAYISLFTFLVGIYYAITSDVGIPDVRPYIIFERNVDISAFVVFTGVSLVSILDRPSVPDVVLLIDGLFVVFLPIQMMWGYTSFNHDVIRKLSVRNIFAFCLAYFSFGVYLIVTGASGELTPVTGLFIAAILITGYSVFLALFVWFLDLLTDFAEDALKRNFL